MCTLATEETSEWLMVDPWEAFQEYQRTAVVLDHFEHEINTVLGGVHTQEGEQRDVRVMLLAGSDLISTMSEPGVWSEADVRLRSSSRPPIASSYSATCLHSAFYTSHTSSSPVTRFASRSNFELYRYHRNDVAHERSWTTSSANSEPSSSNAPVPTWIKQPKPLPAGDTISSSSTNSSRTTSLRPKCDSSSVLACP